MSQPGKAISGITTFMAFDSYRRLLENEKTQKNIAESKEVLKKLDTFNSQLASELNKLQSNQESLQRLSSDMKGKVMSLSSDIEFKAQEFNELMNNLKENEEKFLGSSLSANEKGVLLKKITYQREQIDKYLNDGNSSILKEVIY